MIKNSPNKRDYPQYFIDNNIRKDNINEVINNFNNYFVNVGP